MGKRRAARERALQVLFELEFNESAPEEVLARPGDPPRRPASGDDYAGRLVRGILARRDEIDGLIHQASKNWRIDRMGVVDRNILRIAVFEMLEDALLTPGIVINEALEIAKRFGGEESVVFINGVLDALGRKIRPDETEKETQNSHERTEDPPSSPAPARSRSLRGRSSQE
jgi:N utilization substance protein B